MWDLPSVRKFTHPEPSFQLLAPFPKANLKPLDPEEIDGLGFFPRAEDMTGKTVTIGVKFQLRLDLVA